jgi:hypothetical protein
MFDDYEFYQGVVLRNLIVNANYSAIIRPFVKEGRISAFVVNARIGVFVKHSTKRISPWRFTFTLDQVSDLLDLESKFFDSFVVFVCGDDGLVTLDVGSLHQIVTFDDAEKAWVAVERKPRSQYSVWGNRAELQYKIANGTTAIQDTLKSRLQETRRA